MSIFSTPARKHTAYYDNLMTKSTPRTPVRELHTRIKEDNAGTIQSADDSATSVSKSREVNRTYVIPKSSGHQARGRLTLERRKTNLKNADKTMSENTQIATSAPENRLTLQRRTRTGSIDKSAGIDSKPAKGTRLASSRSEQNVLSESNGTPISSGVHRSVSLKETACKINTRGPVSTFSTSMDVPSIHAIVRNKTLSSRPLLDVAKAREQGRIFHTPTKKTLFENIATKKKAFERLAGKEVPNPASINFASSEISKLGLRVQQTEILPVAAPRGTKASTAKPDILVTPVQARKTSGGEGRNATVAQTSVSAEPLMPSSDVLKQHELLKMENSAVTVAVRLRPFSSRENAEKALQVISMNGQETVVQHPDTKRIYSFTFDFSFYSVDDEDPGFACQQRVYEALARPLLQRAFEGFNTCLFAYGQTGSGKSYTMMGFGEESGVIPRFCQELFSRIISVENDEMTCHLEMSYFEVYNENIHDLLVDRDAHDQKKMPLRVREHPVHGPYVADLSTNVVRSYSDVQGWLDLGNKQRATAATGMNDKSSRSHSVFTLVMTQTKTEFVEGEEHDHRITSKINLVDLAGSERCNSAQTTGDRLREGASINKSLLTLGKVISALSEQALVKRKVFTPYRESVLTWLLKESLGGNSKTAMIATLSPADSNVQESLSTLRYAQQARTIINQAKVNEDTNSKLIRELKAEVEKLRAAQVSSQGVEPDRVRLLQQEIATLKSQLSQQERAMAEAHRAWKEKLERAEIRKREEARELQRVGVTFKMDNSLPNLVNLNEDPQLSEMLLYMIKDGQTKVGKLKAESIHDIQLSGALIADQHCVISSISGTITIIPMENAKTFVNGNLIFQSTILHHGDRVILGGDHYFRFNHPAEVHSGKQVSCWTGSGDGRKDFEFAKNELLAAQRAKLEAEIEEAHVRAKEEMMQGIQMAKQVAQKELCDQKALYEDCIRGLERELEEQAQRKRVQEEEARRQVASEVAELQSDKLELQREVETQKKRLRLQMEAQAMEEHSVRHARIVEALEEEKQKISKDLEEMQMKMALGGNCIAKTVAPQWDAMKLSLMIEEANKISAKLKKNTVFSRHESTQKADLEQGDAVQVRVQNTKMGIATFWSLDKFQDNMASMRELEQGEPTSKGDYVFYGPGDEWEQDLSASSTTTSFSRRKSRSLLKSRRISGCLYEIRVHPIQSLNNASSQSSGLMGVARPPSANLSSSDSAFPGICKELIGQTVARLRCCSGPVESMADHLISDLCSVYTAIHTISELYDHLDEDSQENVFMCNLKAQRQLVMATSALERAVSVTMQWLSSVRATSGMLYSTAEDVKFQVIKMGGFFQLLIQGCESEISSMVTEANKKSGQCLTTVFQAIGHLATLTGMPLNVSELGSRATGKSSGTESLLEGISKGVSSLLVEALHITKEMLRDAQLAYPRTSTLQSLKSKSVDLACALQGYIHCHITERESSLEKAAREQEEEAACHLQTLEEVRNTADRLFQLNQAVGELQLLLATCLRGKVCDVDFIATRVAISSLVRTIDELISGLPRTAAATSSSLQLPCIHSVMSARDELLLALRSLPTAFDQQEAGESKYFTGSDMSTEYRLSSEDGFACQNSSRNILISKMVRHLSSGVSSNGSPQWV